MNIVIKWDNIERINEAIKQAEGRAKERRIKYENIDYAIFEIEKKLDIPRVAMLGIMVDIDCNAQKFPNAYKYTPESTHAVVKKTASGWNLIGVHRGVCRTKKFMVTLTEVAKQALIERCERF